MQRIAYALVCALAAATLFAHPARADDTPPGEPPGAPSAPAAVDRPGLAENLDETIYLPFVAVTVDGLRVNPQDKGASTSFYRLYYAGLDGAAFAPRQRAEAEIASPAAAPDPGWTGDHATCNAGDLASAYRDAILLRINYFRAMAGVPANVKFSEEFNRKAQQAALMMSVNQRLSHDPDSSWTCYTAEGDEAAGRSNLYLGRYGWDAITGYIRDLGGGNTPAGHRRWILYPQTQFMGVGDIPPIDDHWAANALWVFDSHTWDPRPETREEFVAWPPPGFTPYQVVFPLWSFAVAHADFSSASVNMTAAGSPVPVTVFPVQNGFGENAITWEPAIDLDRPDGDRSYQVQIGNVRIDGVAQSFTYDVTIFDPDG